MAQLLEVKLESLPDCWDSCGNCRSDSFEVIELLVEAGEWVERYQPLLSWEADKALFELPAPQAGKVELLLVAEGDCFEASEPLVLLSLG